MQINYEHYLIAFLDILGFKEICKESDRSGDTSKLSRILDVCTTATKALKEIDGKKEIQTLIISDSIILGMKIPEGQTSFTPKEVADFLIAIGRIQFDLFLSEIPLRGGVSIGKVHFDLNQKVVIGPAYIEAYELELQAKYPRVIVSSRLIKELNLETHADLILCVNQIYQDSGQQALYNWDRFGDNGLGKLQKDIPFFIDFLRAKEGRIQVIQDRLDDHVEILNKLTIDNPNHYLKYKWLQDYWLTTYGQALGKYDGKTVRYLTSIS